MTEGKLGDMGVRNLRFLSRIVVGQKLGFEFPFHEFEIDTDLTVLVLGSSKSFLPVISRSLRPPLSISPHISLICLSWSGINTADIRRIPPSQSHIITTTILPNSRTVIPPSDLSRSNIHPERHNQRINSRRNAERFHQAEKRRRWKSR